MRIARYTDESTDPRIGLIDRERNVVIDVQKVAGYVGISLPQTVSALLGSIRWREKLKIVQEVGVEDADRWTSGLEEVSLCAPIKTPEKIVCVGLNYQEHIDEAEDETPENPLLFSKYASAIVGPGEPIHWSPELTSEVDFEVELAAIMGETARRVPRETALDHVAGYTIANDVSARDLQFADEQWVRGKTLDSFCPLGPELVTTDELPEPHHLDLWTDVNGERLQESNTENFIFDIDEIIAFCSEAFTLQPGDVILTGTPPGVGAFREPPVFLGDGDEVTVGVETIGTLSNPCTTDD